MTGGIRIIDSLYAQGQELVKSTQIVFNRQATHAGISSKIVEVANDAIARHKKVIQNFYDRNKGQYPLYKCRQIIKLKNDLLAKGVELFKEILSAAKFSGTEYGQKLKAFRNKDQRESPRWKGFEERIELISLNCRLSNAIERSELTEVEECVNQKRFKALLKAKPSSLYADQVRLLSSSRSVPIIKLLLNSGFDIDAQNQEGSTALMRFIEKEFAEGAVTLIEEGANFELKNHDERTGTALSKLLYWSIKYSYGKEADPHPLTRVVEAILKRKKTLEQPLLIDLQIYALIHQISHLQNYCFARISNFGIKSLHGHSVFDWAARFNRVDFFKTCYLLNPDELNIEGGVLYKAIRSHSVDVAQFLCHNKLCNVNYTTQDEKKNPLHVAFECLSYAKDHDMPKALKIATLLIDHGADLAPFNQSKKRNWLHLITDEHQGDFMKKI